MRVQGERLTAPLWRQASPGESVTLESDAESPVKLSISRLGTPRGPVAASSAGYLLERKVWALDGTSASLDQTPVGAQRLVMLTLSHHGAPQGRLMIDAPIPAGFVLEELNLTPSELRNRFAVEGQVVTDPQERRADRLLVALAGNGRVRHLFYLLRATHPGTFRDPAASVEDMYLSSYRATTAEGQVTITE